MNEDSIFLVDFIMVPILAKRGPSEGERSQVSSDHEEPGAEICHPGAAEGGERGRHGGRRQRDQERHLRLQVRDDRDHEGFWDEHPGCLWRIRLALRNCFLHLFGLRLFVCWYFPSSLFLMKLVLLFF